MTCNGNCNQGRNCDCGGAHQATIESLKGERDTLRQQLDTARKALELCESAFDECRDYPITHDAVIDALAAIGEAQPETPQQPRQESEVVAEALENKTPAELRKEGRAYCPKCFTFGHSHRKDCIYKDKGLTHHIRETGK